MRSRYASFAALAATLALLAACESSSTSPDPDPDPVAVTAVVVSSPSSTLEVGSTMQLTATVSPASVSQAVSWSSSDNTRASVNGSGLVTAIVPGAVRITATSTLDPTRSSGVDLALTGCLPLVQATVAGGATLPADTCYQVTNALTVSGGTLVVSPGVRIEFGTSGSLTATGSGRLQALGTAAKPILFTSSDPVGTWRGVYFNDSRGTENALHHVTIERAGSSAWSGFGSSRTALLVSGASLVSVRNTTLAQSGGTGLTAYEGAELTFVDNTLRQNAVAAWVHPTVAQYIDKSTAFVNNTDNVLRVAFGNNDAVQTAQTWQRLTVPFELQTRMYVDAALTLEPGVLVSSLAGVSLNVRNEGSLTALGTVSQPIVFTSKVAAPGSWKGISIATLSTANRFDHVVFENGGSDAWSGFSESRAMVYLLAGSRAVITNSMFRGSSFYGFWVPAEGDITGFNGNTFTQNVRTMIVHPNRVGDIAANNSFSQNTENSVRVTFGNNDAVTTAQRWRKIGSPFKVMDRTTIKAALVIDAGAELEFAQNASLVVSDEGSLRADGTVSDPVIFRGVEDLASFWKGIQFATAKAQNMLSNVVFRNAGSAAWYGGSNANGTLWVTADGTLTLTNVSFAQTGGFAAIVSNGGALLCSNVQRNGFLFYVWTGANYGTSTFCSP